MVVTHFCHPSTSQHGGARASLQLEVILIYKAVSRLARAMKPQGHRMLKPVLWLVTECWEEKGDTLHRKRR